MITRRTCPECGATAHAEPDIGLPDFACRCGWEEGGPADFGFVEMGDRAFCPLPIEPCTITLRCPSCRKEIQQDRVAGDPAAARLVLMICPSCDDGDFHSPRYFAAAGGELLFGRDF